jgi:hypothetical protein
MTNIKTLTIAAVTALSLGFGAAMAQESAGGVGFGPYETQQLERALSGIHHAAPVMADPQAGSSDFDQTRAPVYPRQTLFGQDGNG